MIVWLASYPRSGNTLLRTILKKCFGLDSYADEPIHVQSAIRSDSALIGHRELPAPWPQFYATATKSPDRFLVKTHLPPPDDQPYIYVVRDGRSAVQSYKKYYARYMPDHDANLYRLIAGDDPYGDWTSHYERWVARGAVRGVVVRFEDLAAIDAPGLGRLAAFIEHRGPISPWSNTLDTLASVEPGFFGAGKKAFEPSPEWPGLANQFFNQLHSGLLERLGYPRFEMTPADGEWPAFFEWTAGLVRRNSELARACDERLALIDRLSAEAQKRLELLLALSPKAEDPR